QKADAANGMAIAPQTRPTRGLHPVSAIASSGTPRGSSVRAFSQGEGRPAGADRDPVKNLPPHAGHWISAPSSRALTEARQSGQTQFVILRSLSSGGSEDLLTDATAPASAG